MFVKFKPFWPPHGEVFTLAVSRSWLEKPRDMDTASDRFIDLWHNLSLPAGKRELSLIDILSWK